MKERKKVLWGMQAMCVCGKKEVGWRLYEEG